VPPWPQRRTATVHNNSERYRENIKKTLGPNIQWVGRSTEWVCRGLPA